MRHRTRTHAGLIMTVTALVVAVLAPAQAADDGAHASREVIASIDIEKSTNGVDADNPEDAPEVTVGSPVTWTYVVTNNGLVPLFDITITDDELGPIGDATRLNPGESVQFDRQGVATFGLYDNLGTAQGTPEIGEPVVDEDMSHYEGVVIDGFLGLDIQKTPDVQVIPIGGTASWTITVTNIGSFAADASVTDPLAPDCDADLGVLESGQMMTYDCSLTGATEDFINTAFAFGDVVGPQAEPEPLDSDTAEVIVENPSIDIQKTPDAQTILSGGTAEFTITVTNTSRLPLSDVTVNDPLAPACDRLIGDLSPGTFFSYDCSLDGVTEGFTNVATVTAFDGEVTIDDVDSADVTVIPAGLEIEKTPDMQTIDVGGTATFTITVRNTSATDLTGIEVTDPLAPDCYRVLDLAAGTETTYDCSVADVADSFTNVATVSYVDPLDDPVPPDTTGAPLDIAKTPGDQTIPLGGTAVWTITVANFGLADLAVTVADPLAPDCARDLGIVPGISSPDPTTVTYTCEQTGVTESFVNTATATGGEAPVDAVETSRVNGYSDSSSAGVVVELTDSDAADVVVSDPGIDIQKTPNLQVIDPGDTAEFTITVENTGRDPLTGVAVADPLTPDCDAAIGDLAEGEIVSYACELTGVTDDFVNVATATGDDPTGAQVTSEDSASVEVTGADIEIRKSPAGQLVAAGGTAEFTITVVNSGDTDLLDITVYDPASPDCQRPIGSIAAGDTVYFSCSFGPVTGGFTNYVQVEGFVIQDGGLPDVLAEDTAEVHVVECDGEAATMFGTHGDDVLIGTAGRDVIHGRGGNDRIFGLEGDDLLCGGTGDDFIEGGAGDDRMLGSGGNDTATYFRAPGAVTADLSANTATGAAGTDHLHAIRNVIGSRFDDTLIGNGQVNRLEGRAGDDDLDGRGDADTLLGQVGDDLIAGRGGDDLIDGGPGVNTASYALAPSAVTVVLKAAAPQATGGDGSDTVARIQNLIGSRFADLLAGNARPNLITGGDGDDELQGKAGDDTLIGEGGLDTAIGNSGIDTCDAETEFTCEL